jgi:hypothetical protein
MVIGAHLNHPSTTAPSVQSKLLQVLPVRECQQCGAEVYAHSNDAVLTW